MANSQREMRGRRRVAGRCGRRLQAVARRGPCAAVAAQRGAAAGAFCKALESARPAGHAVVVLRERPYIPDEAAGASGSAPARSRHGAARLRMPLLRALPVRRRPHNMRDPA